MYITAKETLVRALRSAVLAIAALGLIDQANADQPVNPPPAIDPTDGLVDFAPPTEFTSPEKIDTPSVLSAKTRPTASPESLDAHYRELARQLTAQHGDLELQAPAKELQATAPKQQASAATAPATTTTKPTTQTYRTTQSRTYSRGRVRYTYPVRSGNAPNWQRYIPAPVARRVFRW